MSGRLELHQLAPGTIVELYASKRRDGWLVLLLSRWVSSSEPCWDCLILSGGSLDDDLSGMHKPFHEEQLRVGGLVG